MGQFMISTTRQPRHGAAIPVTGPGVSSASAEAVGRLGAVIGGVATQAMHDQQIEQQRQSQLAEDADKARGLAAIGEAKVRLHDSMRALSDRITTGRVDGVAALGEWDGTRSTITDQATRDLPGHIAERVASQIKLDASELASAGIGRAVETRQRETTRADMGTALEGFERDALTDRAKAVVMADEVVARLGPSAGYGPDDQQRMLQRFREKTAVNMADQRLVASSRDIASLDAFQQQLRGEDFTDLSPDTRERFELRIENKRAALQSAAEVAQRRAEAARERRLREAEHAVRAVESIVDGGGIADDATLAQAHAAASGTPWAGVLKSTVQQAAGRSAFGTLSPAQQEQALLQLRAQLNQSGANPHQMKQLQQFESIRNRTREQVDRDPLAWGVQSRLLPSVDPLPLTSLPDLVQGLTVRTSQAATVGAQLQRPVSPLLANEAQMLGESLGRLPADQKKTWLRGLASVLPPDQQRALAGQLKDQDGALALAMHAGSLPKTANGDPMDLILRGHDAVASGRIKKDDELTRTERMKLARDLDAVPWATPKARDAAADAASLILDGLRDQRSSGTASSSDRKKAMLLALGGEIVDHGDGKTIAPPGWTENRFRAAMRKVSAEDIARQAPGGLMLNGQALAPDALVRALPSARLVPVGQARYALDLGGIVMGAGRQPFTLTLVD
ncbi:hypothetical protein [Roseateles sp.]|uniref:hypothetical protein n=1 Tax=Roseateles sp. TaxID=1971397 RepID=UPI0039571A50